MSSGSDTKLSGVVTLTLSDSEESFDYSFDDSNSELSLSYDHSSTCDSPSPLRLDGSFNSFKKKTNTTTDDTNNNIYSSTQSFSLSSDDNDDNCMEESNSDLKFHFDPYDSNSSSDDDSDYDADDNSIQSPQSVTRLLSLTASDVSDIKDSENGKELSDTVREESSSKDYKTPQRDSNKQRKNNYNVTPPPLEPVGLFWDIENCQVPIDKSAFALANKMRQVFFQGKREAEFMCVCDITKERKEVTDDLHRAHVSCYMYMYMYMYMYKLYMYMYKLYMYLNMHYIKQVIM